MSSELSVEDLLRLARDRSAQGRAELVSTVSDLYFNRSDDLSQREVALMAEILRQLIHDVEMSVRQALARRLADDPHAEKELLVALANDEIEVAHPILVGSELLEDADLLEIVEHRTKEHQLAIAMRQSVSETVSHALVAKGHESVMKALLENSGARISEDTMATLVERACAMQTLQAPLLTRRDLSPQLAKRMYWWVSAALRQHILDNFPVDPDALDDLLEDTVKDVIETANREADENARSVREMVDRLGESDALTPKFLIQVLREGEIRLFEAMFARITELDETLVRRILYEPGGQGMAVACKGIEIEKPDFASLFLLSRQGRPGEKMVDPSELSSALSVYDFVDLETARRVVRRWRLDPDYTAAIRDIQGRMEKWRPDSYSYN